MKTWTYILAAVLAVAVLLAGVVAVNADDGKKLDRPQWGSKLIDRVAQILNMDKQKLIDAFKQAGTEVRQQGLDERLDKWVAEGKLTQDEANQYKSWIASKPAGVAIAAKVMDNLLKNGKITQVQYDAWKTWWDKKPNIDLPKPEKPVGQRPGKLPLNRALGNIN